MIDEDTKTLWCGNLAEQVSEEMIYELFLQAGPLEKVKIPRDRDGRQKSFAFITFCHEVSVPYALNLFRGTALFNRTLNLQSKGRMVMLPPPVRCYGLEMPMNFQNQEKVAQNFSEMTERLRQDNPLAAYNQPRRQDMNDKLVMASLQGNWTHRHHPYRTKDKMHTRDDYRHYDSNNDNRRGDSHNVYRHGDNQNDYRHSDNHNDYRHCDNHNDYRRSDNHDYRHSDNDNKSRNSKHTSWRDRRNHRNHRRD